MKGKIVVFTLTVTSFYLSAFGQQKLMGDLESLSRVILEKSPALKRTALQIEDARADIQAARSVFDFQLASGINASRSSLSFIDGDPRKQFLSSNLIGKNGNFYLASEKKFQTGTTASVRTDYSIASSNLPLNAFSQVVGPNIANHTSAANLTISQALLRDRGTKVNTSQIESAKRLLESAKNDLAFRLANELLLMGNAYWQYLGAFKTKQIFKENEDRIRNVLGMTEELVKADKKPESDLLQIRADLAEQERQSNLANQNLYNARINLGRVIGVDEDASSAISDPLDDFPVTADFAQAAAIRLDTLKAAARRYRLDIKANALIGESRDLQLIAANNAKKPILDLSGFLTYGGAAAGGGLSQYFNAFGNRQGKNYIVGVGLTFSFPVNNNLAKANYIKTRVAQNDQQIALADLKRNIELSVSTAHNDLLNSISVLNKSKERLIYSQQVFSNEQLRFQNGLTTLLNLIIFQDRLTEAQLQYLQAQQNFSVAIIQLRYETGMLIRNDKGPSPSMDKSIFYSLPDFY